MTLTWAALPTPFDGTGKSLFSVIQIGSRILIGGFGSLDNAGGTTIYSSDDGGATWTMRASPFDVLADGFGNVSAFAYSAALGRVVAVGSDNAGINTICYSDDLGDTWTGAGNPIPGSGAICVARDDGQGLFVMGNGGASPVFTSPDGITWTAATTPWDLSGFVSGTAYGICYAAGTINKWVVVGASPLGTKSAMTAADATSTWTEVTSGPFDGGLGGGIAFDGLELIAAGGGAAHAISTSPDAAAWTGRTSDLDADGAASSAAVAGLALVGGDGVVESDDGGAVWGAASTILNAGGGEGCRGLSIGAVYAFAVGSNFSGSITAARALLPTPPTPPPLKPSLRPFRSVRGRLIVTDLDGAVTTWLEKGLLTCTATLSLNQPCTIEGDLRSGDPAVNNIFPADGDPLVAQSNRLVYLLLNLAPLDEARENRWQCAASGVLMSPEDQTDSDIGTTHFTAYDAWQYMMGRPCYKDTSGTQIPQNGYTFPATDGIGNGNIIAYTLIQNTIESEGIGVFADIPSTYGGTTYWDGTNETTVPINFTVQQGTSLGQALQNLASAGNDVQGTAQCIDIVFEPIYDPFNRPGYLAQVSVYNLAGVVQPKPVMGWARFNRSATTADREHDGTPSAFVNVAQFVPGQGGPLDDGSLSPVFTAAASVAKYGPYWSQQFFPSQPSVSGTTNLAVQALTLYKQGKRTFLVDPDPLRAAIPVRDYNIGDRIFIASSPGQRVGASGYQRVQTIPIVVGPDGVVVVSQLLTSPDWPNDVPTATELTPTSGSVGTTGVTIVATGFNAHTSLAVTVRGLYATITAGGTTDGSGDSTVTFDIPPLLASGVYTVVVSDYENDAVSPDKFTVT